METPTAEPLTSFILPEPTQHSASFRDPSGFIFTNDSGEILRQVNREYEDEYNALIDTGLFDSLVRKGWLVDHEELSLDNRSTADAYCVLRPAQIPFVSYPFEWCFGQLQDAALLTLDIQIEALKHGMTLKDASSYNIQFSGAQPTFIDTLSFESYQEGSAWQAYGQFCRHFLAPLVLMSRVDVRLLSLMRQFIDGIPLDLAASMLPLRHRLNPGIMLHLVAHAGSVAKHSDTTSKKKKDQRSVSRFALDGLLDSLRRTIAGLKWKTGETEWSDYYAKNSYSETTLDNKMNAVKRFVDQVEPQTVWDLGANTGVFSRAAVEQGAYTLALDFDAACVEMNYRRAKAESSDRLLPLVMDLSNPSPGVGWAHEERSSLAGRGRADVVMALALVHHLAVGNNVPLERIASYFSQLGENLIIEFVPKSDPQTQRLLQGRKDVFANYDQANFERAFASHFSLVEKTDLQQDGRVLYLLSS